MRNEFVAFIALFFSPSWWYAFAALGPIYLLGLYDMFQNKHAIMRNYPIFGRGRYVMEELRPKIYQYFIESDTNGTPISRIYRNVVYQRAKKETMTTPFGTQLDVYSEGYEWMNHSIAALDPHNMNHNPRVSIGNNEAYEASIFNVSAMSFGSLSKNAIEALNGGAAIGGFAHNTGEGGISPYHEAHKGDLIYQIGTGYFGSRAEDGNFSPERYKEMAAKPSVKMIELKLSQGAKPGHGGILPAKKNTEEIAKIRGVKPHTAVLSPPYHKAFNTPKGLLKLIKQMQDLSGGKPVGFKLCVGKKSEFIGICKAMIETGIKPDFISVDGGEGGTGAAPLEFSNSVGTPFSGKIMTGFHIFKALAIGADITYSARAMMLALGCIQALMCNQNNCPTGVATQDKELVAGLVVSDKKVRVANFHHDTVEAVVELMAAAGIDHPSKINRSHIYRRISMNETKRYDEIFPYIDNGCLLNEANVPGNWKRDWEEASADRF